MGSVKDFYFQAVDSTWGPFTVDCFANSVNAKVSRFYSLLFQPGSLGVDSFPSTGVRKIVGLFPRSV